MSVVVGTAGHIDHGKTALLRALTGIDADRLPEEKRRGLTIDIGYAHGAPDDGAELDFVDVPGHDRLVGNMLVGVGEIDAALLVVAADDGPRPQTWEHLGLLDAMAVDDAVVAVTKRDLVDEARLREVAADMQRWLRDTGLRGAPTVAVSSTDGAGLDELRAALAGLRDRVLARGPVRHDGAWLAVDRVFTVRGHGVVVTGSSRGRDIAVGDRLTAMPGGLPLRVRGVQVHDTATPAAGRGRLALNLGGIDAGTLERGQLLTDAGPSGSLAPFRAGRLLVALRRPAALPGGPVDDPWPPRDGTELRLHIGTDQVDARVARGGRLGLDLAGDSVTAVLRLARPLATAVGERFVLRRPPPAGLLAGGVVLDGEAPRGRARARLDAAVVQGLLEAAEARDEAAVAEGLLALHGVRGGAMADDVAAAARSALTGAVAAHHREQPGSPGLPLSRARSVVLRALRPALPADAGSPTGLVDDTIEAAIACGELARDGEVVRAPGHVPTARDPAVARAQERLLTALDVDAPPSLAAAAGAADCPDEAVRELERSGRIVVVGDDLAWSAAAYARLSERALDLADAAPLTPAALRDATGTSRKYVMALLEDLGRRGILERTPSGHVRGPRAPERR